MTKQEAETVGSKFFHSTTSSKLINAFPKLEVLKEVHHKENMSTKAKSKVRNSAKTTQVVKVVFSIRGAIKVQMKNGLHKNDQKEQENMKKHNCVFG